MSARSFFDDLREINYTDISGSYASVGSATTLPVRALCITNNTDGDMKMSTDGTNDTFFVAANTYKTWDITANLNPSDDSSNLEAQLTFYVKQVTAPTKGDVYIEVLY